FFQAEDGIRDFHVTGVQTCALPIFAVRPVPGDALLEAPPAHLRRAEANFLQASDVRLAVLGEEVEVLPAQHRLAGYVPLRVLLEIGRASCRERVSSAVRAGSLLAIR